MRTLQPMIYFISQISVNVKCNEIKRAYVPDNKENAKNEQKSVQFFL